MPALKSKNRYDAVIVGARCAGASTAMLLARRGARVLVLDHGAPGSDTMSTHALMRGGVMQLRRWGVLDAIRASGAPAIRKTSFFYGTERLEVDIAPAHGTDALFAPRRTVLDAALVAAARTAGATFRFGTGFGELLRDNQGRVTGITVRTPGDGREEIAADIVIGADGRRSAVARSVPAPALRQADHTSAVVYGYFAGLPDAGYRWYWESGAGGGIIPTHGGLSCVFVAMPPADFRARAPVEGAPGFKALAARHLPEMARDMAGARLDGRLVTFRGERGFLRRSQGPGWALVGDAGYFKDPITAHGITDALRDAELLAEAVIAGRPESYPQTRDALSCAFFGLTDRIAGYQWNLDELKALHKELNLTMKTSQNWIAENFRDLACAA